MSKCLFYRKKINFSVKNFTRENVGNFVEKKGKVELKFRVKIEPFLDELVKKNWEKCQKKINQKYFRNLSSIQMSSGTVKIMKQSVDWV